MLHKLTVTTYEDARWRHDRLHAIVGYVCGYLKVTPDYIDTAIKEIHDHKGCLQIHTRRSINRDRLVKALLEGWLNVGNENEYMIDRSSGEINTYDGGMISYA